MFTIEDTEIAKAIDKARELHPIVRVVEFGTYTVTGSEKGSLYTVRCFRDEQGHKTVDCSCRTRDGVACKHGMAAVALHLYMAMVQMIIKKRAARTRRAVR